MWANAASDKPFEATGGVGSGGPVVLVDDPAEYTAAPDLTGVRLLLSR